MRTDYEVFSFQEELMAAASERIARGEAVCPTLHILGEREQVVGLGDVDDHISYMYRLGASLGRECRAAWMIVTTDAYVRLLADGEEVDATRSPGDDPQAVSAITVTAIARDGWERSLIRPYDRSGTLDPTAAGPTAELGETKTLMTKETTSTFAVFFSGLRLAEKNQWADPEQEDDDD